MIGRTLSHYRITGQLGAGGMGIVYAAEDARLGRAVALKFVSSNFAHDEQAVARLRSEAKAASALNHPNICTIYDIGEENGHPFIVMELMKGQSLRERLNGGPLKPLQLVDLGIEVADALHVAHTEGIIHRDIKPGNIFITERGLVKILDFGLAKLTPTLASSTTDLSVHTSVSGVAHGTPAYMSPEQATGELLDGRTDLFSLGVVLYEAATGHHPFPGKTPAVVLAGILDRTPASPLVHNPDLPPRLIEIIGNCLEKDRELRYQSAADLRADLKRLRRDLDATSARGLDRTTDETVRRRDTPMGPVGSRTSAADLSAAPTQWVGASKRALPRGFVWAIAGVVAVVVAAAAFWIQSRPDAVPSEAAVPADAPVAVDPPAAQPQSPVPPATNTIPTDGAMQLAAASLKAGNYRAALASAREVLALVPDHRDALRIREQAESMLARFDNEIADARRRLSSGELEAAARALERARAIDATSPSILELNARLSAAFRAREDAVASAAAARAAPTTTVPIPSAPAAPQVAATPQTAPPTLPPAPANVATARPDVPSPPAAPPTVTPNPSPAKEAAPPVVERPTPPVRSEASDEAAIRQLIVNYGRAIENKDIRLFRSIKPNLTNEEERRLQDGFRAVSSQRVDLTILSIDRTDNRATALIRRRDEIEAGGRRQTTDAQQTLSLVRSGAGWIIVDIR